MSYSASARLTRAARKIPERQPDRGADQRRDDALLAHHPAHLAARHPDRAQHPDLACPLVDREDERVDHPEDAHEHRQREHHVEERDELADVGVLALDPLLAGLELRVGKARDRRFQLRAVLVVRIAGDVRPGPAVSRTVVEGVEELRRDVDALEQRIERGRLERPDHRDLGRPIRGRAQRQRIADRDAVVLGEVAAQDRVRRAERGEHAVVALTPVEDIGLGDGVGLDAADLRRVAVHQSGVGADARHDLGDGRRRERVAGGRDERRVPVERGHDVVGCDLLLDRLPVRHLQPIRERCDERDECDPDHQRSGRGRGPAGVPARVLAARSRGDAIGNDARELRGPLGQPPRHGLPQPHEEHDHGQQRVQQRAADECPDASKGPARAPRPVPQEPVRQQPERPHENGEDESGPASDRAADGGEWTARGATRASPPRRRAEARHPRSRAAGRRCPARRRTSPVPG